MSTRMTARTVVLDLGGVLIDWDPRHLYRRLMPEDEVDDFLEEIGFREWNHAQDASSRPWAEAVEVLAARHPHRRELIAAYPSRFAETLVGPIEGTVEILRELHAAGTPLLALTNWSAETFGHARARFGFLELFDGILVSGEEEVAKPDPRIFAVLVERFDLDPARTLFVDDVPANVEAAAAAGLQSVLFTSPGALRADLTARGVLAAP
ncbi:MAG: HAD family hydrolase [Actinomycetes bacterium]